MTRDPEAAKAYYSRICGWRYDAMTMDNGQDYFVAMTDDRPVAGIMDMSGSTEFDGVSPHWFTYFAVDDVDAAVRQTTEEGGEVIQPPFDVPGIGRIALLKDSSGAKMGMITEAEPS
jgi:predicted enzyme related to lactoylglutathione lyase